MWETPKILFDVDLSELWKKDESSHEIFWKHLHPCGLSYLVTQTSSIDNKIIGEIMKNFTSKKNEVDEILNGEDESKITEFIEFLKGLKTLEYFINFFGKIDFSSILEKFNNIDDMMANFTNISQSKDFMELQMKLKNEFQSKIQSGEFSREVIFKEIELVKLKVSELFGDMFNDILGGRKSDVKAAEILGNSPEARRARMLARLQRKLKERKE
jgi:hypothetical protein